MGELSVWHLILILLIVVALFGTAKLRNIGGDLGHAIRSFRDATKETELQAGEGAVPPLEHGAEENHVK